jgi:hypothetical protein
VLWQHFFWIFGHPEVYVLMIPGFGFASEIIPVFSRKTMFGYSAMIGATVAIGFLGVGVWAHHMFTIGMSSMANTFFMMATMAVGVPTGIKIFNWIATMWGGQIRFDTPMLFCIGFLFQFLIAGLTGIMLAAVPFDWQLSDSAIRSRAFPVVDRALVHDLRRDVPLVPQSDRQDARRNTGIHSGCSDRLPPDVRLRTSRAARHAPASTPKRDQAGDLISSSLSVWPFGAACRSLWNIAVARRGRPAGPDPWDA